MDQERERIQADLRGLVDGEVRCDDVFLEMYSSDASIYQIRPLCVVRPRGVADVVACVQYCAENEIPVHARGAGTSVAGNALGPGLVLDFSHAMRRILGANSDTVRVQPGVVHAQLNSYLDGSGRLFGPDPSTRSVTTMGSVLALDASGSHFPRFGAPRDKVVSMQVVLADGSIIEAGRHAVQSNVTSSETDSPRRQLVRRLAELLERNSQLIEQHRPRTLVNTSGYQLHDVLKDGQLDLARLMVGSEGTLGLITEATLKTDLAPRFRGVALLFFDRLESAAQGALALANMGASACDLLDRRTLSIAREADVRFDLLIPPAAEAMLLVEKDADDLNTLREQLQQIVVRLQRRKRLAFDARITIEKDERDLYWRMARRVIPILYRLKGSTRPLPFIEDIAVPPETLPDFLVSLQNILKTHQVTASLFAHASHGQIHVRPFLDLADPEHLRTMQDLASDLYAEVVALGGTISGEHGDGLSRTWYVRRQYGPLYDVFREVKRIFDPHNILNPGKVVADVPQPLTKNLRPVLAVSSSLSDAPAEPGAAADAAPRRSPKLQLIWNEESVDHAARACNGCGRCRTTSASERMCPIFRFAPAEEASPRAKANLMRAVLTGRLDAEELNSDTFKSIADLCVNCHQCRLECPASVDIPKLMIEAKGQYVATNGLRPADWFLSRPEMLSSLGSRFAALANWSIGNRTMRWIIERVFGVAQGRKLPRFAQRSFLRRAQRRRLTRPSKQSGNKVLYFVDVYANWHDVDLAEAFVTVLEHNGVPVYVHPGQLASGMARLSKGAVEAAREIARRNVAVLVDAVRQGYQIVCTEPSAALCLTHEYPNLLDDDDARLVAQHTSEACTYLWRLHLDGKLALDLKPVNTTLGYHQPCHLKALGVGSPGENLLRLVPGLSVTSLDRGCSGMAGTFGLKRQNYRASLRAGWGLISSLRDPAINLGATECSACKMQMEQGTTKPTIHPIKILAMAYGLMPEFVGLLSARSEELIVT
ncbi:MAG: anaerobic glycerol-3-phosphate dehydrogenase subunit C [Pirellulaceae bacterium]